jgi:hypothetical protein
MVFATLIPKRGRNSNTNIDVFINCTSETRKLFKIMVLTPASFATTDSVSGNPAEGFGLRNRR